MKSVQLHFIFYMFWSHTIILYEKQIIIQPTLVAWKKEAFL